MLPPRLRRLTTESWFQKGIGILAAEYLRLVWNTTQFRLEPANIYERIEPNLPIIIAMWHGQHFLMPFVKHRNHRAKTLISHHRDGAMNAAAANWLGVEAVRGSGTQSPDFDKKGGAAGFRELLQALEEGYTVALTADVPKVARVCGLGIVKLASMSGRPIYPMAIATSRRRELNNWDRSAAPLPFGRGGRVTGEPIYVAPEANDVELEAARRAVEESLNAATARAYEIADRTAGVGARG